MCRGMTDRMKTEKMSKHVMLWAVLILIAAGLEYAVYLHYDSLRANPVILNSRIAVAPVYNTDGSWLHGIWEIGYNGVLLCLENIGALLAACYLFRFMEIHNTFFGLSAGWLYLVDLEIAVPIYRLLARTYRTYTLDYLYIQGYGTFDFPDFCIGAGIVGILLWMIPALFQYYRYKKERTAGMSFLQKLKWEFRIAGRLLYLPFVRKSGWEERFEKWRAD